MASGYFVANGGQQYPVASNSCADAKAAADYIHHNNGYPTINAQSCSTDPVAAGTIIYFNSGTWSITEVTATANIPVQDAEAFSVLIIVIAIIGCFFAGVAGYKEGRSV